MSSSAFTDLLRRVEYTRIVSGLRFWLFHGAHSGQPTLDDPNLIRMQVARTGPYLYDGECIGHCGISLRPILEDSNLMTIRNGIRIVTGSRLFPHVIRPTVDTLFLIDSLEQYLINEGRQEEYTSALEIGVGSGLALKTLVHLLPNIRQISGVDVNPNAADCARANLSEFGRDRSPQHERLGRPGPNVIETRIWAADARTAPLPPSDLVVCNPPYVPLASGGAIPSEWWFLGTDLIRAALRPELLSPGGRLLLTVSEAMAGGVVMESVQRDRLTVLWTDTADVPFRVWEVINDPARLDALMTKGFITERGGSYFHRLRAYVIGRHE